MTESIISEKDFHESLKSRGKTPLTAVALKYPENSPAPFITAIGKGEFAKEILKIAHKSDIIVVENKELTDVLSFQDIGTTVSSETWEVLAQIFAFVLKK